MREIRAALSEAWEVALRRVHGRQAVHDALVREGGGWHPKPGGRLRMVSVGKAAMAMAAGAASVLGRRLDGTLVVTKRGHALEDWTELLLDTGCPYRCIEAGHPYPDATSGAAGLALRSFVAELREQDLLMALVSGGASALTVMPRPPCTLQEKLLLHRRLVDSALPIDRINAVRRRVSAIKGGALARWSRAPILVLGMSDVPGDAWHLLGGGLFHEPPADEEASEDELLRAGIRLDDLPGAQALLRAPRSSTVAVARSPGVQGALLVATLELAVDALAPWARARGLSLRRRDAVLRGEAAIEGRSIAREALDLQAKGWRGLFVSGGEPVVTLGERPGVGGRAQELAFAAAEVLRGSTGVGIWAAGTDGTDGPTDAAGAYVDGATWPRMEAAGWRPEVCLTGHDTFAALRAIGASVITKATGTNVNDLVLTWVGDPSGDPSDPQPPH